MKQPYYSIAIKMKSNLPTFDMAFYVENAFELLDTPGEWYFDRSTRELFYYPVSEGMAVAEVYVPMLKGEKQDTDNRYVYWVRREGDFYGGQAYYAARYKEFKIMQNNPWEPYRFFNLKEDPSEQHPINATGSKEYKSLNAELMHHIQASGGIPWQANK